MNGEQTRRQFVGVIAAGVGGWTAGCQASGCATEAGVILKPRAEVERNPDPTPPASVLTAEAVDLDRKSLSDEQIRILRQATDRSDGYTTCLDTHQPEFEALVGLITRG